MVKQARVRGMNAAAEIGAADTRRSQFPHASIRQLLVAVAILAIGAVIAWFTLVRAADPTSFTGTVQPAQSVNLDFGQTGPVAQILVKPGQQVSVGQALATQDQTAAKAALTDARSVLTADQAKLAALSSPTLSPAQEQTLNLQVAQANGQLSGAQQASSDAIGAANAELAQDQQALDRAQTMLNDDSAQFRSACQQAAQPADSCSAQQAQVQQDSTAVSTATAALGHTRATVNQSEDNASSAVTNARDALAVAENQRTAAAAPATPADLSSAQADVAAAQSTVDSDSDALTALTLRAPLAGLVADVGGQTGELDGTTGVHAFAGPQSLQTGSASNFSLFPAQSGDGATQNSTTGDQQPLISLVTAQRNAVAQVGEDQVSALHQGAAASITVNALHDTVNATVAQVIPIPVSQGGSVDYEVQLVVGTWPPNTEPGMSLSVEFR
jgi:multidrug resistance efflux pump